MTGTSKRRRGRPKTDSIERLAARNGMTSVTVNLTIEELSLLTSLAADQLFRREFIEPKMPGYKGNSAELSLGKALVARLRSIVDPGYGKKPTPGSVAV